MTNRNRIFLSLGVVAAFAAACAPEVSLDNRPCPCATGSVCCPSTNTCVADSVRCGIAASDAGGGLTDAGRAGDGSSATTLVSTDCPIVTGDTTSPNAVILGFLGPSAGGTYAQSVEFAVDEFNKETRGLPSPGGGRLIGVVECAEGNVATAAQHLVDVHVAGIIGPFEPRTSSSPPRT